MLFIAQSLYIDVLILQYLSPYTLCIRTHYTTLYLLFHAVNGLAHTDLLST